MSDRERDEANFTALRIFELELTPVAGVFDVAHLREINRRIFQDLPGAGYPDVTPGEYRPPVPPNQDWIKARVLSTVVGAYTVAYSRMDKTALKRLDMALRRFSPLKLKRLDIEAFVDAMVELYVELDYVHPFADGNSRTLRTFTRQLAKDAGYELDWTMLANGTAARDTLYVARDNQVNRLAQAFIVDFAVRRETLYSMDVLAGNPGLRDLLARAIVKSAF